MHEYPGWNNIPKSPQILVAIIFPLQTLKTWSNKLSDSPWLAHCRKPSVTHDLSHKVFDSSVLGPNMEKHINFMHNSVLPAHTLHCEYPTSSHFTYFSSFCSEAIGKELSEENPQSPPNFFCPDWLWRESWTFDAKKPNNPYKHKERLVNKHLQKPPFRGLLMISKNLALATPILKITSDPGTYQKLPKKQVRWECAKAQHWLSLLFLTIIVLG